MDATVELNKNYGLSRSETTGLSSIGTVMTLERNELLRSPGSNDDSLYIVTRGAMRQFCIEDGEDLTVWFFLPGEIAIDTRSYKLGERSNYGLATVSETELVRIEKVSLMDWCQRCTENGATVRKLFEGHALIYEERILEFFSHMDGRSRYLMMMKNYPEIFREMPLKQLATYLCITPQSLSRIRRSVK